MRGTDDGALALPDLQRPRAGDEDRAGYRTSDLRATHPVWAMQLEEVPEAETEIGGALEKSGDGW